MAGGLQNSQIPANFARVYFGFPRLVLKNNGTISEFVFLSVCGKSTLKPGMGRLQ
jgi:hypothetical protein